MVVMRTTAATMNRSSSSSSSSKPPLHNFPMPYLKWGNQKLLRCENVISKTTAPTTNGGEEQDFNPPAEKFLAGRRRSDEGFDFSKTLTSSSNGIEAVRAKLMVDLQTAADKMKVAILGEGLVKETMSVKEKTALEVEEDFMLMAGHKPHRRPKKRPKIVQKQLDSLFPGLWLTDVTADMYKVADAP